MAAWSFLHFAAGAGAEPEAYVLKAALDGWIAGEDGDAVRRRAAESYHKYQRCGLNAALRLFASGW